jgi:serine/threonine protein kinase
MKFGQYELLERVAVGGMAEVYRGRVAGAEGFEKWVAIKRILPEYARDDRFISMMLTEARIHSGLSHRNIVQIHDLGISEDGEYFIVLEYVEGHDLRAIMESATELGVQIPDSLALHIADELAQALHFAHELKDGDGQPLGIIHRDVSPSNVLISNSGEVKLSDFGIAKRRHDHSFVGSLKGNLVYMSPEQAQRVPLDRRTDVFSLGAVLFEMLTGQKLRDITDEVNGFREVASGVIRSARALRPDLPEAYEALLSRALAANPADRFPDAAAFGDAIRELGRENGAPVGPADMKELIELFNPPRRARSPVERSKVIRLGPEFKMLAGAARPGRAETQPGLAAPPLAPGVVPAEQVTSHSNGNGGPIWADRAAARLATATPPPLSHMAATPPPPIILAPPPSVTAINKFGGAQTLARMASDVGGLAHAAAASADPQATPPPPPPPPPPRSVDKVTPLATPRPVERAVARATAAAEFAVTEMAMSMPTPPPIPGAYTAAPIAPYGTGPSGPIAPLAPAAGALRPNGPNNRPYSTGAFPTTAVIAQPKRRGRGRSVLVLFLVAVSAGAAVVHYKVVPLDVVVVWLKPAALSITSQPPGATVTLDGRTLPDQTPLRVDVRRDRAEHLVEFSRMGSLPARATLRFDRTVTLSQNVVLDDAPPPPPPPVEVKPVTPTPAPVVAPEPAPVTKKPSKADKRAAKAAAKAAKLETKKAAKAGAKKKLKKKKAKGAKKKASAGGPGEL